jgi:hypothetical protein
MRRSLWIFPLSLALALACGARSSEQGPALPAESAPRPAPAASAESPAPDAGVKPPPTPPASIDPSALRGYVRGLSGPEVGRGDGAIASVDSTPRDEYVTELRLVVTGVDGRPHRFSLIVPRALPVPFAAGDRVRFRASAAGGGPNRRTSLVLLAADGSLLLAIDIAPEGWKVERGKRVATDRGSTSYVEHTHEVVFTHAGTTLSVAPGSWARLGDFYVWGTAAQRDPRSARLPPDYVGSWLDFAVVRAR